MNNGIAATWTSDLGGASIDADHEEHPPTLQPCRTLRKAPLAKGAAAVELEPGPEGIGTPKFVEALEPTVFLVVPDATLRAALVSALGSEGFDTEVFESTASLLASYDPARSGCVLFDASVWGLDELDLQQELLAHRTRVPLVLITVRGNVSMAVQAMKRGAFDCVAKPLGAETLLVAVKAALEYDARRRVVRRKCGVADKRLDRLTTRERQVMMLVAIGQTNKEIARKLEISPRTVEVHRAQVRRKLQVTSLAQLVALACSSRGCLAVG